MVAIRRKARGSVRLALALGLVCVLVRPGTAGAQTGAPPALDVIVTFGGGPAAGVRVSVRRTDGERAPVQESRTDAAGTCRFGTLAPGIYEVRAARRGLTASAFVTVTPGAPQQVTLVLKGGEDVSVAAPATEAGAAAPGTTLSGDTSDRVPVAEELAALLPLVPGVIRSADGRIQLKGGQATQGGFRIDGASSTDPSTGEFTLALPSAAAESVTVLANPYAAEYGRFTSAITEVQTRQGGATWRFSATNFIPRPRLRQDGVWAPTVGAFTPRVSVDGPIVADRLFLATTANYRFVKTRRPDLPSEPNIEVHGLDAYTRFDTGSMGKHRLTFGHALFPRTVERVNLDTFNPPDVTYSLRRHGFAVALTDRAVVHDAAVLETTVSYAQHDLDISGEGDLPMTLSPAGRQGHYFNDQVRDTTTLQSLTTLSFTAGGPRGERLIKVGADILSTSYTGQSVSRTIDVRRGDGTLVRRIAFSPATQQDVSGTDVGLFLQARWQATTGSSVELGLRSDRDGVTGRTVFSPRAGVAMAVGEDGRGTLRAGVGVFQARTPLNIGAFETYEQRTETWFAADGVTPSGAPVTYAPVTGALRVPRAVVWNVEFIRRLGTAWTIKLGHLRRRGSRDHVLEPVIGPAGGELRLDSVGRSRYWEQEITVRYLASPRRDLTATWVISDSRGDLNTFDTWFGNAREPVLQSNAYGPIGIDVPHRLLVRGTIGLPGQWDLQPLLEVRNGFPYSRVDETQTIVGARNAGGRFPRVALLDVAAQRPLVIGGLRLRVGLRVYNLLGRFTPRDVQNNVAAPDFGAFFNRIDRSFGAIITIDR